jgi:hypothetical protein
MASRNSSAVDGLEYERVLDRVAAAVRGVLSSNTSTESRAIHSSMPALWSSLTAC